MSRVRGAKRVGAVLGGLACCGLLAGCGIPTEGAARSISASDVPYHLLSQYPPATTPTTAPQRGSPVQIFLVKGTLLVKVPRYVVTTSLTAAIEALLQGPTAQEVASDGISSALSAGVRLLSGIALTTKTTVATVNLSSAFGEIPGQTEIVAVAQVVYTVDTFLQSPKSPTAKVYFEINGIPTPVPVSTGAVVERAVTKADYLAFTSTQLSVTGGP